MTSNAVLSLRARFGQIDDLESAAAVLDWDQATYMPPGGAAARARQIATLTRMAHELKAAADTARLVDDAQRDAERLPPHAPDAAFTRLARRSHDRARRVPSELVAEVRAASAASYVTWAEARPKNDFAAVLPHLEKTLELSRRWASYFPEHAHPADVTIDEIDHGFDVRALRALFTELRAELVPLVAAIAERPRPNTGCLHVETSEADQLAFAREIVTDLGYSWTRGRLDLTPHPFMTKFSTGDVRITTRVHTKDFRSCFFGSIHECGHALYEQGIRTEFENTPLANGASSGVHESQSRFWENQIARSAPFWEWCLPRARARFPQAFGDVSVTDVVRAINCVEPGPIRTEADEVTYNLHIMIRFDLECAMLEGKLGVRELADAWNERYESDLGVRPPDFKNGVMQDVHWFSGMIAGQFQGYTLGNLIAAQLREAADRVLPSLERDIAAGDFAPLRRWLGEAVHQHGMVFTTHELIERATGSPIGCGPFVRYLTRKYGALYGLGTAA